MSVSKIHHCIGQEMVAQGRDEPPATKCRCRKYISLSLATVMVARGEAKWVVIKRTYEPRDLTCPMCHGDKEVKNCAQCFGKGTILIQHPIEEYNNEIVYGSEKPKDKSEKKYRPTLAMKTPRVATIEAEHILRAYVSDEARDIVEVAERKGRKIQKFNNDRTSPQTAKAARDRIEEYGRLILDARMYVGPNRILAIVAEPEDDAKTGTGRRFDYGRTL